MSVINLKGFRPLSDRLLVNVHKEERESTIIRPIGYAPPKTEYVKATVVSKGTFVKGINNRDVILIEKTAGIEIIIKEFTYRLLRLGEVVAKI